jgi:hypothetical protein
LNGASMELSSLITVTPRDSIWTSFSSSSFICKMEDNVAQNICQRTRHLLSALCLYAFRRHLLLAKVEEMHSERVTNANAIAFCLLPWGMPSHFTYCRGNSFHPTVLGQDSTPIHQSPLRVELVTNHPSWGHEPPRLHPI